MTMLRLRPILIILTILILGLLLFQGSYTYGQADTNPRHLKPAKPKDLPILPPPISPLNVDKSIDWTKFAYLQYVTASEFLCCSVMIFQSLDRLKSKADRVLLYPESWGVPGDERWLALPEGDRKLLDKAREKFKVKLRPVGLIHADGAEKTWEDGYTKLLAFNQTDYARTILVDSDATILQSLDHLFLLPPTPLAIPRAYWLMPNPPERHPVGGTKTILSAQVLIATPNGHIFHELLEAVKTKGQGDYDMEIINWVLGMEAMIIPHRGVNLLSGEFRQNHTVGEGGGGYDRYLGIGGGKVPGVREVWDAQKVLEETMYVHFSDWPRPKPWYKPYEDKLAELTPPCTRRPPPPIDLPIEGIPDLDRGEEDCSDRKAWLWLYEDYRSRRKNVCGLDLLEPPKISN